MARRPKGAGAEGPAPAPATADAERINLAPADPKARAVAAFAWRRNMGFSRADLAELSGFSESLIRDFEAGTRRGKSPEHRGIDEASWRRYGLACAAIEADLEPLF